MTLCALLSLFQPFRSNEIARHGSLQFPVPQSSQPGGWFPLRDLPWNNALWFLFKQKCASKDIFTLCLQCGLRTYHQAPHGNKARVTLRNELMENSFAGRARSWGLACGWMHSVHCKNLDKCWQCLLCVRSCARPWGWEVAWPPLSFCLLQAREAWDL